MTTIAQWHFFQEELKIINFLKPHKFVLERSLHIQTAIKKGKKRKKVFSQAHIFFPTNTNRLSNYPRYFFQEELKIIYPPFVPERLIAPNWIPRVSNATISNHFPLPFSFPKSNHPTIPPFIRQHPFRSKGEAYIVAHSRPTKDWWNKKSSESLLTLGYASISVTKHDIVPSPSLLLLPLFTGSPRRFAARRGSTNPGWWRDTAMLGIYYLTPLVVQRPLFAFCVSRRGHSAPRSLVRFRFRRGRIVLERVDVRKPRGGAWWIVSACVRACIFQRYQDTARRIRRWRILGSSNFLPFFFRQSLLFSLSLSFRIWKRVFRMDLEFSNLKVDGCICRVFDT